MSRDDDRPSCIVGLENGGTTKDLDLDTRKAVALPIARCGPSDPNAEDEEAAQSGRQGRLIGPRVAASAPRADEERLRFDRLRANGDSDRPRFALNWSLIQPR